MVGLDQIVVLIFLILFILGGLGTFFTGAVIVALLKHRRDKVPFTYFLLHKEKAKKEFSILLYPGITLFISGLSTLMQKLFGPAFPTPNSSMAMLIVFFTAYISGIVTVALMIYIMYRWFVQFRRFL